ncbi:hypothetical protein B2A_11220, partial [mine drainage metagenome]
FLYRLSRSHYPDRFILTGALLMLVWLGETIRPTRDADLLGFGDLSQASLTQILQEVVAARSAPDGVHQAAHPVIVYDVDADTGGRGECGCGVAADRRARLPRAAGELFHIHFEGLCGELEPLHHGQIRE